MLKNYNEQIQTSVKVLDAVIATCAFFAAYALRHSFGEFGTLDSVLWMLVASLVIHFFLYPFLGFYESVRLKSYFELVSMIVRAMIAEFFILGTLVFVLQQKTTSRYFFGLFLCLNYGLILFQKCGGRVLLTSIRKRGYNYRRVLIAGTGENAKKVLEIIKRNKHWGYVASGFLVEDGLKEVPSELHGVRILGAIRDLKTVILKETVDEIYFAPDHLEAQNITEQVALCEQLGIPAHFSLSLFEMPLSKVSFGNIGGLPVMTFYRTARTPAEAAIKRTMDFLISIVGLLITGALYPWIAFKIKKQSPGPVIFKQVRVGENGRLFKCYKFRTMNIGADALQDQFQAENKMKGPMFKLEHDPRVFQFGNFLRQTSLDELPQFFNIFRGDMSVVGTRPPTPDEVKRYETHYRRRLSIRPGLTGLWQVSGRSEIRSFEDVLSLDLKYIDDWSIWLDVQIIFRTIWATVFRRGAV